jgi:hypothetical protein
MMVSAIFLVWKIAPQMGFFKIILPNHDEIRNQTKIMFNILKCEKHANALTFLGYKVCSIHLTEDIGL